MLDALGTALAVGIVVVILVLAGIGAVPFLAWGWLHRRDGKVVKKRAPEGALGGGFNNPLQ